MSISRLLLILLASLTLTSFVTASDTPTLQKRLEKLAETLETARIDAHIPGMSIAIVKDDEIIWARGFGLANVESQRSADEHTIYAVGSTTKAFTATLIGMLVDEGKMSWDDPVTKHLPYFDLAVRSDDKNAECTLRDLLSHRHGFVRMGILILSGKVSREEVLHTAAGAEPWDDFRRGFHYTNIMFLAAGQAAGVASGSTWDEMMAQRIFKPLNMTSTTVSMARAQKDPRLALGYKWDKDLEQIEHMKMIDFGIIGPAGAVNSNVLDMAQWLRFQLGQGEVDGKRLISTERILDTWMPQIEMAPGRSYGLGWMLREYEGHKVVEHGGATDGFSAQVGLIPDENLGFVLLTNLNITPFREASLKIIFDALLEEWPQESVDTEIVKGDMTDVEEINFDEYVGTYIANFAKFRDEEFEIVINEDRLVLDIPSQRSFDLKPPDEQGMWTFALTDSVALSFKRDNQGVISGLTMHQSNFHFEVPREGFEIDPEVPASALKKYVGTYVRDQGGKRVKISIEQGHLAMEDKGNMLSFRTPDTEGNAPLIARPEWGATFTLDAEGMAESFIFHGGAGDKLFNRLPNSSESRLTSIKEVLALRKTDARSAAMKAAGGTKITGEVWIPQAGVRGTLTIYTQGNDRFASHMDFGKYGRVSEVVNGDEAWSYNSLRGFNVQTGDERLQAILGHPGSVDGDWSEYFDSIKVVGDDTFNDRPVHVLRLTKGRLPSCTYRIDAEHGDVLRMNQIAIEAWGRIPITTTYSDFQEIDGIRRAMRIEVSHPMTGKTILTFEKIESGLKLDDEVFTLEDTEPKN